MRKAALLILFIPFAFLLKAQDLQELLDKSSQNWESENYEEAFGILSQAVELAKQEYEKDPAGFGYSYGVVLNQLGVRLFAAENYETAASYYNAAIPLFKEVEGEESEDYLVSVENLAICYESNGQFDEALKAYDILLSNRKYREQTEAGIYQTYNAAAICAYQIDAYEVAKNYYKKGISYLTETQQDYWVLVENLITLETSWSKYIEAYKYLEPFLEKFPEKLNEYSNAIAYRNRDLGYIEFNKRNYAGAIPFFKETIKYLQPTDSIDELSLIYIYEDLAAAFGNTGNHQEGFPFFVKNAEQTKAHYGETSDEHLYALSYLSVGASELGEYKKANRYYREAYRLIDRLIGAKKGEMRSTFDTNYADYFIKQGEYDKAKEVTKRAFDFYATDQKKYQDALIYTMNLMGIILISEGKYDKAESMLKQTLRLQQDAHGFENEMGTKIASNLTSLYIQTGRNSRAYQFLDFILANDLSIHGENSLEYSFSLQVAGVLYISSGAYEEAIASLSKAHKVREPLVGTENRELLRLKKSLGTAWMKSGKIDEAIRTLTEVLEVQKHTLGANNFDVSLTQNDLGLAYFMKKEYAKAAQLFETSYRLDRRILGRYNQLTVTSQYNLAGTNIMLGDKEKAFQYFRKSMGDYLHILDNYFPFLSEKERLEYYHTIKGQLGAYYSFLTSELSEHPEYAALLYDLQMKTKAILLSESMKLRNFLDNHNDKEVQVAYEKWNVINKEIAKLEQTAQGVSGTRLDSLKIVGEEYERALNSMTEQSLQNEKKGWKDVAATLKDGEVAIEIIRVRDFDFENIKYREEEGSYLALIVDNKTEDYPQFVQLKESFLMESKYFKVYQNSIKYKQKDKLSYLAFWKPVAEKLSAYEKAFVSADGVYHLLNLNTLFNLETDQYLINEFDFEIVGNTSELLDRSMQKREIDNAVLFGFPNFNTTPDNEVEDELRTTVFREIFSSGVSDLPQTRVEINNIETMMASSGIETDTFLEDEAHEEQLKGIDGASILHVATHGFFEESSEDVINDDPLTHSGLLLANIKESVSMDEENGIITAKEVAQLDLSGSRLVVLSACETGKGKVVNGEGVYGLQRAFQVAGADNVIISLWKVDDTATQLLMTYFYEVYLDSLDPRAALWQAQIRLQQDYPHPNYWGAFYVVGK